MDYARIRQRRESRLSVLAPRQQTTMRHPQTKTCLAREPPWGPSDPPFREKGGDSKFPKQSKKTSTKRI